MPRTKGSKNRVTVIADQFIADGMDSDKAKVKARMQFAREKKSALQAGPKKRTTKKSTSKKDKIIIPEMVAGYNSTTQNAWKKAAASNSRKFAIRAMCLLCLGGSVKDVKTCTSKDCPLYKFRITG